MESVQEIPYVILQHIPKSASTSLSKFFNNSVRYGHRTGECKLNQSIPAPCQYISFTVLRNPLRRFLSCVRMFLTRSKYVQDQIVEVMLEHNFNDQDLQEGIMWRNVDKAIALHSISIFHPFLNVFDEHRCLYAQYLIDFDNLVPDLQQIIPQANYNNLKNLNKSYEQDVILTVPQIAKFQEKFKDDLIFYENFRKSRYYKKEDMHTLIRV